jgi:MFS family permease
MSAVVRLLRAGALDIGPLRRQREFRLLYTGQAVSFAGSMITAVAIPFQVYELTRSTFVVGLLGLVELAPLPVTALIGGALADAHDRRRLVLIADATMLALALVLAGNALLDEPRVWVLFVVASGMSGAGGLQRPAARLDGAAARVARRASRRARARGLPRQCGRDRRPGARRDSDCRRGARRHLRGRRRELSRLARRARPHARRAAAGGCGAASLARIAEGWRYARGRQDLIGTYLVDINAMPFAMPVALFPAVAERYGGAEVLGLLFAAGPASAFVLTLSSGWTRRVTRHGRAVAVSAALGGTSVAVFGLVGSLPLAIAFLALAGAADMSSGIFRSTMWNQTIPDSLRGRLAGIEQLSYSIGPTLGTTQLGAFAALTSVRTSLVAGGFLCLGGTIALCALMPRFWRYDAEPVSA